MTRLTELRDYGEAHRHFSKEGLWALFDGDRTRFNIAHECLDRHPVDRPAVRIAFSDGRRESHTFGELSAWAARFARWLGSQGVKSGDRVAVMLEPALSFYMALFGTMKAGAVAVPLFTLFGPDGLRLRLADCEPALVLTEPDKAAVVREAMSREGAACPVVVADDAFLEEVRAFSNGNLSQGSSSEKPFSEGTSSDDMAMYQYTSGTTRELPEAVQHRHRALVTVMIAALYGTGVRPGDRFMCPSSPAWGHGLWHGTLAPLAMGVTIAAWCGPFNAGRLLEALEAFRITNLSAAATHFRMMMNSGRAGDFSYQVDKLSFTGEPMDSTTAAWARKTFGTPACSIYGTTEVGVVLAQYPGARDLPVIEGALGKPVPGVELAVHDDESNPCPPGEVGHLMFKRRTGWFPTKDRAHTDAQGHFFYDGRSDDVIISAGWTMSAVEIEDVLLKHPWVAEAAVIAVPDETRGQVVKAFLVMMPGKTPEAFEGPPGEEAASLTEILQAFVQQRLSRHEYPRRIAFVAGLPKTQAGKVNRRVLRDQERQSTGQPQPGVPS